MSDRQKARRSKRRRPGKIDPRLEGALTTTYSPPRSVGRPLGQVEGEFAATFPSEFPVIARLWSDICTLHSILLERRTNLRDSSQLRTALDLLSAKGFADARGAQVLLERGYAMASLGPLRAALETSDLMRYFLARPDEVALWAAEDKKFDSLAWIRDEVDPVARNAYGFMNWGLHPNWRLIPDMLREEVTPVDTHYEIVAGPVRGKSLTETLSAIALHQAIMVVAVLHEHNPQMVSDVWRDQFRGCADQLTGFFEATDAAWREKLSLLGALAEFTLRDRRGEDEG